MGVRLLVFTDTTKCTYSHQPHRGGVVEKPDVVGAIFGQTEGLLGEDLDLRDLQRTGRVGRIDVQIASKKGETAREILISSSLRDRAETAILAASLEAIDRVEYCCPREGGLHRDMSGQQAERRLLNGQRRS